MAHELIPRDGKKLSAGEVAQRLAAEFAHTKVDAEEGLSRALSQADWLERAPAHIFFGHHDKALQRAAMLKKLAPGDALAIEFGDDQHNTLKAVVLPGATIKFGYGSNEEQDEATALVERCARVLDCDVKII